MSPTKITLQAPVYLARLDYSQVYSSDYRLDQSQVFSLEYRLDYSHVYDAANRLDHI